MTSRLWRFGITLAFLGFASMLPAAAGEEPPVYLTQWGSSSGTGDGQFIQPSVASPFDGVTLSVNSGVAPGSVSLAWTGGQPTFRVYRSPNRQGVTDPVNLIGTTDVRTIDDTPPTGEIFYYQVASPCVYNPPEFCNGIDDDCDGTIDGPGNPCGSVNFLTDLATAPEPPTGWTASGGGARAGITITTLANTRVYTRADLQLTNREAWAIQAVFSANALGAAGERGPRLWARFTDPDGPAFPPGAKNRFVEARFMEDGTGARRIGLFDGNNNTELASVNLDWATAAPRFRVRLKRREIAGVATIFLQVEASNGFDDPANPDTITATGRSVPLANFQVPVGAANELGFGNAVAGGYSSDWQSVHVTRCDDATTALPYWPEQPPAPGLAFSDQGPDVLQSVQMSEDLNAPPLALPYVATDVASFSVTHLGGTATQQVPDPSNTNAGVHSPVFPNLVDDQTVSGRVRATEVAGRFRESVATNAVIPDRTTPAATFEVLYPGGGGSFVPLTAGMMFSAADTPTAIAVRVIDKHTHEAGSNVTIGGITRALTTLTRTDLGASGVRYAWDAATAPALATVLVEGTNNLSASIRDNVGQTTSPAVSFTRDTN